MPLRILVIDDYRPHGESLDELLRARGHDSHYAPTYRDAEDVLRRIRFDVALLDHDMPEMTGTAVAARLAERFPDLRSVIVSANLEASERVARTDGLLVLSKPVRAATLFELIARLERETTRWPLALRPEYPLEPWR